MTLMGLHCSNKIQLDKTFTRITAAKIIGLMVAIESLREKETIEVLNKT